MKTYLASLATLCALMTGCAASLPNVNVSGYDVPQGFQYPGTDNSFINEAIVQHKAYAAKDSTPLFTAPAPATVDTCGVSPDQVRSMFIFSKEGAAKMEAVAKKATKRIGGMDGSYKFQNEDPEFQFLEALCPVPGQPGNLTVRFKSGFESNVANTTTTTRTLNVAFVTLDQDRKPGNFLHLSKGEVNITGAIESAAKPPVTVVYSVPDGTNSVMFARIVDMDTVIFTQTTPDKKRFKTTSWVDGQLSSVNNFKGAGMHGENITFARKVKLPGSSTFFDMPETRMCYRDGVQVKTTGPCVVD